MGGLVGIGLLSGVVEGGSLRDELVLLLLVFFLILPLANAVWDWLSWWATRALGARLVRVLEPAQSGGERAVAVLGHGLGDLAIALGLLLAMAFSLAFGFEAYDQVALRQTGVPAFNLRETVAAAAADPWGEGFWLTTMLLSTLFPTLLHALVLLGAPLGLVLIPTGVRLELAALLDGYDDAPDRQAMIRRKVATWWVYGRFAAWTLAGLLLTVVLLRWPTVVYLGLLNPAEMARWAAEGGIGAAEWLGRVLLGNAAMQ